MHLVQNAQNYDKNKGFKAFMAKIAVINGPNLNRLAQREVNIYGHHSLADIQQRLEKMAATAGHEIVFFQSNSEGALIDAVQSYNEQGVNFIMINPAAYTHTSIALRDALLSVQIPFIEVHLSNVHQREAFRHHSYFSDIAQGVITGLGAYGYELALSAIFHSIHQQESN